MRHKYSCYRYIRIWALGLLLLLGGALTCQPVLARTTDLRPASQDADLSNAVLRLEDLPEGFEPLSGRELNSLESSVGAVGKQISRAIGASLVNFTGFRTQDSQNPQFLVSGLITPITAQAQSEIDRAFGNPDSIIQALKDQLGGDETSELPGYKTIGTTSIGFITSMTGFRMEYVVAHRGPVLIEVANLYRDGQQPRADIIALARILDDRVADVVGRESGAKFRPAGSYVPELTTYIPTPLDVSTNPGVLGTNLLLAALLMLPFAVAAELFTRTLGEHEDTLQKVRPLRWVFDLQKRLGGTAGKLLEKRSALQDILKLVGVMVFYGLVFSLLDRTWKPLSVQGVILFLSMVIAYGLIGIADDIIQWRTIRKWGLSAELSVRPSNFLLAMASTATSRLLTLVPGLMFGTPQALLTNEEQFDEAKRSRLLKISARTLVFTGLGVWLSTAITFILQRLPFSETVLSLIGGLEGFLLVVFAVALENLFIQMLGFPGGLGEALKRRHKWLWLAALTGVTFFFYHTLINPRGELAEALQEANVWLFFGIALAFVALSIGLRFYLGRKKPVPAVEEKTVLPPSVPRQVTQLEEGATPPPSVPQQVSAVPEQVSAVPQQATPLEEETVSPAPIPQQASAARSANGMIVASVRQPARTEPDYVSINETKQCPVCSNQIKAEARVCRFCRATFTIAVRGYCMNDHDVVDTNAQGKCARCAGELTDIHVVSRLLKAPGVLPVQTAQAEARPAQTPAKTGSDTKACPACGQIIKAEARICRFCHTRLD